MNIPQSVSRTSRCLPFLLAGGRGSRLHELTNLQCKPALSFGSGEGRIVDFILAAAATARFENLFVATQYRPNDLCRHLNRNWAHSFEKGITIRDGEFLSPYGYRGTADAVRCNATAIDAYAPREIMVLAGDHVVDIDLETLLDHHRSQSRPATVAATAVPLTQASDFGIFDLGADGELLGFAEKPEHPTPMIGESDRALASTGIYVFDWIWLKAALRREPARPSALHDFGHDILPIALAEDALSVYRMPDRGSGVGGYWRDVGSLDAYRLAQLDFSAAETPVALPKTMDRPITQAIGCLSEGTVFLPGSSAGRRCQVRKAIVAPGVRLPDGFRAGYDSEEDRRWFRCSAGGTLLITAEMVARREAALRPTSARPFVSRPPRMTALSGLEG